MAGPVDEQLLDERLALLEKAKAWSPRVVSKLESLLRSSDEAVLFRVNPLSFAAARNIEEGEAVDLFLHATASGLFGMSWHLLCPKCSCVVESFRSLKGVNNSFRCKLCQTRYEASLDDLIAVTFTVSPQVRTIALHRPDLLSAWDYFFQVGGTPDGRLADGTPFVSVQQALTKSVTYLPAGETTPVAVAVERGIVFGGSMEGKASILYTVDESAPPSDQAFPILFGEADVDKHAAKRIPPGVKTFLFENTSGRRGTMLLAILPTGFEFGHAPISFVPFLTGKRLLTTQAFRDLFRSEVIRGNEGIGVREITLLFTDLKGSTALYERIGDLNAFTLVQQHFDRLLDVTVRHDGVIIKTIGDAVMAAFLNGRDAVRAALAMRAEIARFSGDGDGRGLVLKIGVHTGAAIAVTLNERLDYFGQTVNVAARVQSLAEADEIYITREVFESEGVGPELAGLEVEPKIASLRGIDDDVRVYRFGPAVMSA
jgi:class 3 adenylate cyclase